MRGSATYARRRAGAVLALLTLVALVALGCRALWPDGQRSVAAAGSRPMATATATATATAQPTAGAAASPPPAPIRHPSRIDLDRLRPSLDAAAQDVGTVVREGCHGADPSTVAARCTYGDPAARRTVVALGDSHMAQWWPALDALARQQGWRLVWFSRSGCPWSDVTVAAGGVPDLRCDDWRAGALAAIAPLPRVDLAVVSSSHNAAIRMRGSLAPTDHDQRARAWARGARRTVDALLTAARRVVILRDTPHMRVDVPACLRRTSGDARACSTPYDPSRHRPLWDAERSLAERVPGVSTVDLTTSLCSTECPPASDGILRWRDEHHLTATFARSLAPELATALGPDLR